MFRFFVRRHASPPACRTRNSSVREHHTRLFFDLQQHLPPSPSCWAILPLARTHPALSWFFLCLWSTFCLRRFLHSYAALHLGCFNFNPVKTGFLFFFLIDSIDFNGDLCAFALDPVCFLITRSVFIWSQANFHVMTSQLSPPAVPFGVPYRWQQCSACWSFCWIFWTWVCRCLSSSKAWRDLSVTFSTCFGLCWPLTPDWPLLRLFFALCLLGSSSLSFAPWSVLITSIFVVWFSVFCMFWHNFLVFPFNVCSVLSECGCHFSSTTISYLLQGAFAPIFIICS